MEQETKLARRTTKNKGARTNKKSMSVMKDEKSNNHAFSPKNAYTVSISPPSSLLLPPIAFPRSSKDNKNAETKKLEKRKQKKKIEHIQQGYKQQDKWKMVSNPHLMTDSPRTM